MRILFMGTPAFAVPALRQLAAAHEIVGVISREPARAGRGKKLIASAVQQAGEELNLHVAHTQDAAAEIIAAHSPDFCVVAAYGKILPPEFLGLLPNRFINIHASLLPRWRGAAPIARAICAGDTKSGISIMQMEAGLDTGAVLLKKEIKIGATETATALETRLAELGAQAIITALADYKNITPTPQDEARATYAAKINKTETQIDWNKPAKELDYFIRGLYPRAWCINPNDKSRIRVLLAKPTNATSNKAAGTILDDNLNISCGGGSVLQWLEVQREGRAAMSAAEFLRGNKLSAGTIIESDNAL